MAKVQLSDLMNPLTKIQASTQRTVEKLDSLIAVVTGNTGGGSVDKTSSKKLDALITAVTANGTVSDSLNEAILGELTVQTQILNKLASKKGGGLSSLFGGKKGKGDSSGLKDSGSALSLLGAGTADMAKALILFTFVPKKSIVKFQSFIVNIFSTLTNYDQKEIQKGAKNLMLMGDGIMNFSKSLALSALLLIPGMIAIPFLILSIGIMSGIMMLMGMKGKQIGSGAKALDKTGDAIKSFGIGLAVFAITTFFILMEPKILLGMVASLVLIGGTVALLGLASKQIKKGATALALTGIGLGIFAVGYGIFALVTSMVPMEDLLKQALIIGGTGVATMLIGMGFANIALGSIALALMGVGLTVFSVGYGIFALATKGITTDDALVQAAVIGGMGVATMLIGMGFANIALGSIALALVGIGLAVFSVGYGIFALATKGITTDDALVQAAVIGGMGGAFALIGIPLVAGAVILGAIALGIAGLALLPLSLGLKAFQSLEWKEKDSEALGAALGGIRLAFTGGESEGGFLSKVGGAFTGMLDSGVMVASAVAYGAAGLALISLSAGLKKFTAVGWTTADSISLGVALSTISTAFAQAGGDPVKDQGGLLGKVFGNVFTPNAVERGIDSVMDAGDALTGIAKGLTAFQALVKTEINFAELGKDIELVVGFISTAFALIGKDGANVESGGFFSGLLGIKSTATEEGIRSVMDAGDALTGIAKGLEAFQGLKNPAVTAAKIGDVLGFVSQAFAVIGGSDQSVESGGFFSGLLGIKSTATEEGIRSVKGAGEELKNIADALIAFNGLKNPEETATKIKDVLGLVGGAFAAIGGAKPEESSMFGLLSWDEDKVQKGISAVDGAGSALTDIAEGLLAFTKIEDPTRVAATIKMFLESLSGTFTVFYDQPEFSTRIDNFSGFITSLAGIADDGSLMKAADGFEAMAQAINSVDIDKATAFQGLFEASANLTEKGRNLAALEALVESIQDVKSAISDQGTGVVESTLNGVKSAFGFGGGEEKTAEGGGDTTMNDSLKALQVTLNQINTTLADLPGDIAGIEIKLPRD